MAVDKEMIGHGILSILKNGAYNMASGWLEHVLRTVYIFALARFLGPAEYGIWAYGIAAYSLAIGLIGFGFESLLPIRLGADKREASDYIGLTATLRFTLLAVAAMGFALYAFVGEPDHTARTALWMLIPALAGRGAATWARVCFLSYERLGTYVKFSALMRISEVCVGLLLLFFGAGLVSIVAVHSLLWLVEGGVGSTLVHKRLSAWTLRFDRQEATAFLKQGAILGLATGLFMWLTAGPLILIRHFSENVVQIGQIAIPLNVTIVMVASTQAYLGAALPILSRSTERRDPRVAVYGGITLALSCLIAVTAGGIGYLFGPPVLTWALGDEFGIAGTLLGPCLFIGGIMLAPTGYAQTLLLQGHRWHGVFANGVGALTLLIGLPAAYGVKGLDGAVIAIGLAWVLRAIVLIAWGLLYPFKPQQTAS